VSEGPTLGDAVRRHVETYCGELPAQMWRETRLHIGAARYADTPTEGLVTFMTIGLHHHAFRQPTGVIRQELLVCVDQAYADRPWEDVLFRVAEVLLDSGEALPREQVVGGVDAIFAGGAGGADNLTAVVAVPPTRFPLEFCLFEGLAEPLVFVELVPLKDPEAEFVRAWGWDAFAEGAEERGVDLLDLTRAPLELPAQAQE
jgi:hypothetical protein